MTGKSATQRTPHTLTPFLDFITLLLDNEHLNPTAVGSFRILIHFIPFLSLPYLHATSKIEVKKLES